MQTKRVVEGFSIENLSTQDLLDLILLEVDTSKSTLPSEILELCNEAEQAKLQKQAKRAEKKQRIKAAKKAAAKHRETKKITFLLKGDQLKEVKRCLRWERIRAMQERMNLARPNVGLGSGGGSGGSGTAPPVPRPAPPMRFCSICNRRHP